MNLIYLFKYIDNLNFQIDQDEFLFQFNSHPNYPSLLAVSETLTFFKIHNIAAQIVEEELSKLPESFVGLIEKDNSKSFPTYIKRVNNRFRYWYDGSWLEVDFDSFQQMFKNVVLLAEENKFKATSTHSKNRWFMTGIITLAALIYFVLIITTNSTLLVAMFTVFCFFGTYISYHAMLKELGIESNFAKSVCSISKNTDCKASLNMNGTTLLGKLGLGGLSLFFFSCQTSVLLICTITNQLSTFFNISAALLLLSLPIVSWSLYEQYFKKKKPCPICTIIVSLFFLELSCLLALHDFTSPIDLLTISTTLLISLCTIIITYKYKEILFDRKKITTELVKVNRLKRNYDLFKLALTSKATVFNPSECPSGIMLGNSNASLKLTIVSSLSCPACIEFHKNMVEILELFGHAVSINLKLSFNPDKSKDKTKILHLALLHSYKIEGGAAFLRNVENWNKTKEINQFQQYTEKLDPVLCEVHYQEQEKWIRKHHINFTPTVFINGYELPKQYEEVDLIHFIAELIEEAEANLI
nr:thioredoxin domain-containing protein [uncultured Undibacterium sp.]